MHLDKEIRDEVEKDAVDETEYYAWNELRLHPLLMKSIYKLGFKEPTAIQKACIPAAAYQGKVGLSVFFVTLTTCLTLQHLGVKETSKKLITRSLAIMD